MRVLDAAAEASAKEMPGCCHCLAVLISLCVDLALLYLLFLGCRWMYRKLKTYPMVQDAHNCVVGTFRRLVYGETDELGLDQSYKNVTYAQVRGFDSGEDLF